MKLTRENLKGIVKEEVATLREEQEKLDEIDGLFDRIGELSEGLAGLGRIMGAGPMKKAASLMAKFMKKLQPAAKVSFIVKTLLPAVGLEPDELLQHVGRVKSAAGDEVAAATAAPAEDDTAPPPGSRY
tara:strand:+ start:925 stop:1311 length:387 start_codon:yes stop_codon:yes gene_type:complete